VTAFLRQPALFPARIAGETWGEERCDIDLAGEAFRIDGLAASQRQAFAARYKPAGDAPPAATIQLFRVDRSDFLEIDTRGWEYAVDLRWTATGFTLAGMRVMARVDLETGRGGIWTCVTDPEELWGIVENVLRPLLAARLLDTGGLLVHSAASLGILYAGHSGDGKSTIARMALDAGLPVLSDDLNAVVRNGHGFTLMPLPFTGDLEPHERSDTPTPLRAVMALHKGEREALAPLSLAESVSLLVRCAPYVNRDPQRMPLLLDRAAEVAGSAPKHVLSFRRDGDVWPILRAGALIP
jgi:hypothetical protein